jgi:hypothetical protein
VEARMRQYKIYIVDDQNHISLAHDFEGPDDLSALDKANTFSDAHVVEVWQQARLVARVAKGGEAATASG